MQKLEVKVSASKQGRTPRPEVTRAAPLTQPSVTVLKPEARRLKPEESGGRFPVRSPDTPTGSDNSLKTSLWKTPHQEGSHPSSFEEI
jgi:hypothetical protein